MCGLCGLGSAGAVTGNHLGSGPYSGWPSYAADLMAEKGLTVADGAALFGATSGSGIGSGDGGGDPTGFTSFRDIRSDIKTDATLDVGQRVNAEIGTRADTDWFRMELTEGVSYEVSMKALTIYPGVGLDPKLFLINQAGEFLPREDDNGGEGTDALMFFTATRTGTYYVGATGYGGDGSGTVGNYEIALGIADFDSDDIGNIPNLAGQISVDETVSGRIDYSDDEDWYTLTVKKGKTYAVFLDSAQGSSAPLGNPSVEVLDKRLSSVAFNDDNGITRNAALTFTADYNGKYYIKALGGPGNTGDFKLTVADFTPPEPPSPLDALNWGDYTTFGKSNIKYYFAKVGETFANETTDEAWNAYEKGQAVAALKEYSRVTPLTFQEVGNSNQADFILTKNFLDSGNTGRMVPQDPNFSPDQGVGWFNTNPTYWSRNKAGGLLEQGSYGYSNFIHEFGHGLGLSHPHDNGGGTAGIFAGVTSSGDTGDNDLNQEVFTIMSYNKGWATGFNGASRTNDYGIARTPMAFDIAAIQLKYGVNENYNKGNNTYKLWTKNDTGTGYEAIWDTGGRDTIVNPGSESALIDLRPATLKAEAGGGGFVSYVTGIFGGYTIANGVRIENAKGGSAADTLIGNNAKNKLDGGGGKDVMFGGKGNDTYVLSQADERIVEPDRKGGTDTVMSGKVSLKLGDYERVENLNLIGKKDLDGVGTGGKNKLSGNNGDNVLKGGGGNDVLKGGKGNDVLVGGDGKDRLEGNAGRDKLTGNKGPDDFVFKGKFGTDKIRDFDKGTDELYLSKKLWDGNLSKAEVVSDFASKKGGNIVFDFDGGTIILQDIGSKAGLADDIVFI